MTERLLDLLYRSFDDELPKEEQRELAQALISSPDLREEKKRVEEMRQMIEEEAVRSFKPFFSARVMRRLRKKTVGQEDFLGALVWAFRRVALAGILAILLIIADSIFVEKNRSLDSVLGMPQVTLEEAWQLDFTVEEEK
jgi:anti-sigma factor RsiW